ncbi:hypothetical protein A1F99_001920 [Pyrenophora tritici-repentis]|nr:hypothetical protein A1F99_001920 [Pyrenophora tritici-repentis]
MAGERTSSERAPVARTPAVGMASSSRRVVPTLEALLGTTNIKPREWHHIDPEMWEDNLEAPDDEVGITTATTYIARAIADYTDRPTADEELFWEFRQDFEGWTEAMFLRAQPIYTKELKRILRFKGVYTGRINMAPSESLARLLRMEEYLEWPQDVFQSAVFDTRSAAHMLQERALRQQRSEGSVQSTDRRLSSQAQSRTQTPVRTRGRDVDSRQTRDQDQTHARVQGRQETVEEEQQIQDQLAKTIEKAQNQPIRSQPIETTESAPQPAYQRVQSQQPPLTYNNFDRFRETYILQRIYEPTTLSILFITVTSLKISPLGGVASPSPLKADDVSVDAEVQVGTVELSGVTVFEETAGESVGIELGNIDLRDTASSDSSNSSSLNSKI